MSRSPDHPIFAALCLRPSARDPTPLDVLLKTKVKPQFDRAVDRTVDALFLRFSGLQSGSISAFVFSFLLSGRQRVATAGSRAAQLRRASNCHRERAANRESNDLNPGEARTSTAICHLLIASCWFSKIFQLPPLGAVIL